MIAYYKQLQSSARWFQFDGSHVKTCERRGRLASVFLAHKIMVTSYVPVACRMDDLALLSFLLKVRVALLINARVSGHHFTCPGAQGNMSPFLSYSASN